MTLGDSINEHARQLRSAAEEKNKADQLDTERQRRLTLEAKRSVETTCKQFFRWVTMNGVKPDSEVFDAEVKPLFCRPKRKYTQGWQIADCYHPGTDWDRENSSSSRLFVTRGGQIRVSGYTHWTCFAGQVRGQSRLIARYVADSGKPW